MDRKMHKIEDIDGSANANISFEDNSILLTENGEGTAQLSAKSYCYTYTTCIKDFSKCLNFCLSEEPAEIHLYFKSSPFLFGYTKWCLHFSVVTESVQGNRKVKEMKVILSRSNVVSNVYFKHKVSIVDENGEILLSSSPEKTLVGNGDRKEYSYPFLPQPGTESFVFPNKLIVRTEFSALMLETDEDKGSSFSKSDNQNVSETDCCTKNDATSVCPTSNRCTIRSVFSGIRSTSCSSLERVCAEMREFLIPILLVLCVSLVWVCLVQQDRNAIPTIKSNEINQLIVDSANKLNLISGALNLTDVREKSLEILALYSKMYNKTDHVMQITDPTDHVVPVMQITDGNEHVVPVMQSVDSNVTEGLVSKISTFVASKVKLILGLSNDTHKNL